MGALCWAGDTAQALTLLSDSSVSPPSPNYRVISNQESGHERLGSTVHLLWAGANTRERRLGPGRSRCWQDSCCPAAHAALPERGTCPCCAPACPRDQQGLGGVAGTGCLWGMPQWSVHRGEGRALLFPRCTRAWTSSPTRFPRRSSISADTT